MFEIKVKLVRPNAKLPVRAHPTDAAFDLFAATEEEIHFIVSSNYVTRIETGIVLELPEGVEAQIWPRSSDTIRDMFVHPATIDPGYRGEIIVLARMFPGCDDRWISCGERIGQLKFIAVMPCKLSLTEHVNETERGKAGFGSTGRGITPKQNDAMRAERISAVELMKLPVEERSRILAAAAALAEKDYNKGLTDFEVLGAGDFSEET